MITTPVGIPTRVILNVMPKVTCSSKSGQSLLMDKDVPSSPHNLLTGHGVLTVFLTMLNCTTPTYLENGTVDLAPGDENTIFVMMWYGMVWYV